MGRALTLLAVTNEPALLLLSPPPPPAVSEADVAAVALAIEHLLVPGKLTYDGIVQVLAEGGVAPWLGAAVLARLRSENPAFFEAYEAGLAGAAAAE